MSAISDARLVMDTIAELHKRGYGRLKLFCYIKEGLGVWRHWLFVSDSFPSSVSELPRPSLHGSIPWLWTPTIEGNSPEDAADRFIETRQEIALAARGEDSIYTSWYSEMLKMQPSGILEMESPNEAMLDGEQIDTPYSTRNEGSIRG